MLNYRTNVDGTQTTACIKEGLSVADVYDKQKYHLETTQEAGLPDEHAFYHLLYIFRWLVDNQMIDPEFRDDFADEFNWYMSGECSVIELYEGMDGCLTGDMLTDEANAFGDHYFSLEEGTNYLPDLEHALDPGDHYASLYHIRYNEENYQTMKAIIDRRYSEWKLAQAQVKSPPKWWPFGKN